MTSHRSQWQTLGHSEEVELGAQDWGQASLGDPDLWWPHQESLLLPRPRQWFPQGTVGGREGVGDRNAGEIGDLPKVTWPAGGHRTLATPSPI